MFLFRKPCLIIGGGVNLRSNSSFHSGFGPHIISKRWNLRLISASLIVALSSMNSAFAAMIAGVAGSAIAEDVITFPSLSNWTAASSVSEGFNRQLLSVNTSGWDPIFNPITSNCDYSTNTVLLADSSANFKQNQNYFIHARNDLSIDLSDSTLRLLDESNNPPGRRYELATLLKVDNGASMNFIGSESSAIQMKGQGSRAIFVKNGSLDLKTGHVWIELKNDKKSSSNIVQVQSESSFKIDAVNDIVFIADLRANVHNF